MCVAPQKKPLRARNLHLQAHVGLHVWTNDR